MLVLSRRLGEKIVLPGLQVTIQVLTIKPGVVRIGINAPPDVPILREEILEHPTASISAPGCSAELCCV
jgi:two-component system, OmpR family, response regulator